MRLISILTKTDNTRKWRHKMIKKAASYLITLGIIAVMAFSSVGAAEMSCRLVHRRY